MYKQEKGVTLIALVITIIILIILAAVAIAALTGDNGLLKNAELARTSNAYSGADEQIKLAYMAVRTRIQIEAAKNSSYKATDAASKTALLDIVKTDLKDTKFTFCLDGNTIYVLYTDTNIAKHVIEAAGSDTNTEPGKPRLDTYVYSKIELTDQSASYTFDVSQPAGLTFAR